MFFWRVLSSYPHVTFNNVDHNCRKWIKIIIYKWLSNTFCNPDIGLCLYYLFCTIMVAVFHSFRELKNYFSSFWQRLVLNLANLFPSHSFSVTMRRNVWRSRGGFNKNMVCTFNPSITRPYPEVKNGFELLPHLSTRNRWWIHLSNHSSKYGVTKDWLSNIHNVSKNAIANLNVKTSRMIWCQKLRISSDCQPELNRPEPTIPSVLFPIMT